MHIVISIASPFYAFQQSDLLGRLIVLLLIAVSTFAWTIMIEKWSHLKSIISDCNCFWREIDKSQLPHGLFKCFDSINGPLKRITLQGFKAIALTQQQNIDSMMTSVSQDGFEYTFTKDEIELIHSSMLEAVDLEIHKMEENLGLLGSIVSVSPFVGLLGTVWGVMMAFTGMAVKGKADINAIAPSVSGALLTTVVALLVAIPSLVGYNQLNYTIKILSRKFEHFIEEVINLLKVNHQKS